MRRCAAVLAVVSALLLSGCSVFGGGEPDPADTARQFTEAWASAATATAAGLTDDPAVATKDIDAFRTGLGKDAKATVTLGDVREEGSDAATAAYSASWSLPGVAGPWTYSGSVPLARTEDGWQVQWTAAVLHPKLIQDAAVAVTRALPERAALQDAAGAPLFARSKVVTVGVEPRKATDLPGLARTLASVLGVTAADVVADVRKAKADAFVPVITLRDADYQRVKPRIYDLPGTVFRSGERLVGPTARFAQPLLGRVGEATQEVLKEAGPGYAAGDELGVSGLQRALNPKLSGTAGATITATVKGGAPVTLGTVAGKPGTAVKTTLDRSVQTAADAAVATVPQAAALVAVRPSTGEILAVADNEAAPYEIGLDGRFPAGSTFKIVTATALLSARVATPTQAVACPATTVVYGKTFQNEDRFDLGTVPLRTAFAKSCNTTFTGLSQKLPDDALTAAAASFGIGTDWQLPVSSFGGSVPAPRDDTEKAADAIGQGRVEVSPLAMALASAAVVRGGPVTPVLVAGESAGGTTPAGPPAAVLPALRDMMRAVVTEGTATALRDLPGAPVSGKTGTAEYGTASPPRSHAWFTGFRGDLAFAVFVQDGQSSKTTAVPVSRAFLTGLS